MALKAVHMAQPQLALLFDQERGGAGNEENLQ